MNPLFIYPSFLYNVSSSLKDTQAKIVRQISEEASTPTLQNMEVPFWGADQVTKMVY